MRAPLFSGLPSVTPIQRITPLVKVACSWVTLGVMLVCLAATPAQAQPAATRPKKSIDTALISSVFNTALTFLIPRTLDAHTAHEFALWGLNGLTAIDPSLSVVNQGRMVSLSTQQETLISVPQPKEGDVKGWVSASIRLIQSAWDHSALIRAAGQQGLTQVFFDEIFNHLDPYSRYVAPAPASTDRSKRDGGIADIGIQLEKKGSFLQVSSVNANSPAWNAGITAGDRLLMVDGRSARNQSPEVVQSWLQGKQNTEVRLKLSRNRHYKVFNIRRAVIPPETVFAYTRHHIAILRITSFSSSTAQELSQYLDLATQGKPPQGLIIDLRGNRGGVLQQAIMASALVMDHGVAATTHGRDPQSNHIWAVQGGDLTNGLPIVALVDGRTASAAEILAAALADHRRAVVVGSATFGKGLVQTIAQLPDDGELFVTWSRVIAPLGWPIQGLGVMPQVCTSLGGAKVSAQLQSLLQSGQLLLAQAIAQTRKARYPLPPSLALDLRKACPAAVGTDADIEAARFLIAHPAAYAVARDSIPNIDEDSTDEDD